MKLDIPVDGVGTATLATSGELDELCKSVGLKEGDLVKELQKIIGWGVRTVILANAAPTITRGRFQKIVNHGIARIGTELAIAIGEARDAAFFPEAQRFKKKK